MMSGARAYHEATKHSPQSVSVAARSLDWPNRPYQLKEYIGLEAIRLPAPAPTGLSAPAARAGWGVGFRADAVAISRILRWGAGVRRVWTFSDRGTYHYRTYPSAGALDPVEVYLACGAVIGIESGLYHYHPGEHALRLLRPGDPRPYLVRASGGNKAVARAPAVLVVTGIPWRTSWKYGARGWRHLWWDSGTMLANVLALASASGLPPHLALGFADAEVNALIGVDGRSEMALAVVALGALEREVAPAPSPPVPVVHEVRPLSARVIEEPVLLAAHEATSLVSSEDAAAWRRPEPERSVMDSGGPPPPEGDGIEEVIWRRGSARVLLREPISETDYHHVIGAAWGPLPCDWGGELTRLFVVRHGVEEMRPGAFEESINGRTAIRDGDLRLQAQFLTLGQPLGGDSAATVFLCADLDAVLADLGERGYRAAQLEAGIRAGRMILAAYERRLGATGLTFFDDEVRRFFETWAEPMIAVAFGVHGGHRLLRSQ